MLTDSPVEITTHAHGPRPLAPLRLLTAAAFAAAVFVTGWIAHAPSITAPTSLPTTSATSTLSPRSATTSLPAVSRSLATSTAADRLAAAITAARQPPGGAAKLYEFAQRLGALDSSQYPALLEALRRAHFPDTSEMLAMLCSVWAAHDGAAAFAAARGLAATDSEYGALHAAITAWAGHDPEAARRALEAAHLTDFTTDEMTAFVQGWATADPVAVQDFLERAVRTSNDATALPAAILRGYEAVAAARIQHDPAAALAWYQGLDQSLRVRTQQAFLGQLAAADPRLATAWLANDASQRFGESDLLPVLRGMQFDDWDRQFAWARNTANADTRDAALRAVVHDGASTNLLSLGEWLAARSDDTAFDGAIAAYATRVVRKSPEAAVTWASSLESAELRRRALTAVASEWSSYDFRAAQAWAQRTHLVDWETIAR